MILFATAYDPATVSNLSVARQLRGAHVLLLAEEASRAGLWHALATHPERAASQAGTPR